MSFSSTISHSPRERKTRAHTLSEALFELGFVQAKTQNYDWMTTYPDAIPLLEEIRTNIHPSCVLAASDAEKHRSLTLTHEHVSPSDIVDAARPLINAPLLKDVTSSRKALIASLRNKVENLKTQRKILQDACADAQDSHNAATLPKSAQDKRKKRNIKLLRLRATIERLKEFASQDLDALQNDSDVLRYCDAEAKHNENIASVVLQRFRRDLSEAFDYQASMTQRARQAVNAYAKLKRMQCMYRALVIRDAAMIASLEKNDGKYLEMTSSSMHSLIKELQNNSEKAMQLKANKVAEASREALQKEVGHFSHSERVRQQNEYIDAMQNCVSLYVEQRIRIHCLQVVASHVTTLREQAVGVLEKATPDLSRVTFSGKVDPSRKTEESNEETENNESWRDANVTERSCNECKDDTHSLQALEDQAFSFYVGGVASEIASLTTSIPETSSHPRSWLRFSSHPQSDALINELEAQLGQNTAVLEALLQKKAAIVDKASASAREHSPSVSWVSRINATSHRGDQSPDLSSNGSSISR